MYLENQTIFFNLASYDAKGISAYTKVIFIQSLINNLWMYIHNFSPSYLNYA